MTCRNKKMLDLEDSFCLIELDIVIYLELEPTMHNYSPKFGICVLLGVKAFPLSSGKQTCTLFALVFKRVEPTG